MNKRRFGENYCLKKNNNNKYDQPSSDLLKIWNTKILV